MPGSNFASVKLSAAFVDQARREAETVHRSVGAQVEYWARLGQAIENAPGFSIERVRQTLRGGLRLEQLSEAEQDAVFDGLAAQFDRPDSALREHFAELGAREGAVGADDRGRIVRRQASGRARKVA